MPVNLDKYLKSLITYAESLWFSVCINKNKIEIFPRFVQNNPLLILLYEVKDEQVIFEIRKHRLCHINDEKNAWGKKVSAAWLRKYFVYRSFYAARITANFLKYDNKAPFSNKHREVLEKIEKQYSSYRLYQNEKTNFENYSITNYYNYEDAGPLNDDWDASDWENYMGGPDF